MDERMAAPKMAPKIPIPKPQTRHPLQTLTQPEIPFIPRRPTTTGKFIGNS